MYAVKSEQDGQRNHPNKNNNPWFAGILFLCVTALILSAMVFYVIKPKPGEAILNKFSKNEISRPSHMICIDEDMTIEEIANDTNLSYEALYTIMNIPAGTDPQTTLSALFNLDKEIE